MTYPQPPYEPEPKPLLLADIAPRRRRSRRRRTTLTALAVAAVLAMVGLGVYLAARGSVLRPDAPETFQVNGKVELSSGLINLGGGRCEGYRGYDDIREGAQVAVTDPTGRTVALGRLQAGVLDESGPYLPKCVLRFSVDGVPSGLGFYGIEVSHRGRLQYAEAQMREYQALSLG